MGEVSTEILPHVALKAEEKHRHPCHQLKVYLLLLQGFVSSKDVFKGEPVVHSNEGPWFRGGLSPILGVQFFIVNDTDQIIHGLRVEWHIPSFLELESFISIGSPELTAELLEKEGNTSLKLRNFSSPKYVYLKFQVQMDPHGVTQKGKVHNVTTWFHLSFTSPGQNCFQQWYPYFIVFYSPACSSDAFGPLTSELKESHMTASSMTKSAHSKTGLTPFYARINSSLTWTAALTVEKNRNEYIEIEFFKKLRIEMLGIKGRECEGPKSLLIYSSNDGVMWRIHPSRIGRDPEFPIEYDWSFIAMISFSFPITSRFIRINPRSWTKSMRWAFDIYGCVLCNTARFSPLDYGTPLGVETGTILDHQFTSSSPSFPTFEPHKARLNAPSAWCANSSTSQPIYLQIDLLTPHVIKQVVTQAKYYNEISKSLEAVTAYYIQYGVNESDLVYYTQNSKHKVFLGNLVEISGVKHKLLRPITAQYLRFLPDIYVGQICFRVELYGRTIDDDRNISVSDPLKHYLQGKITYSHNALNLCSWYYNNNERTDFPPILKRSFLLEPETGLVFLCNADVLSNTTAERRRNIHHCHYSTDYGIHWRGLGFRMLSILGYDSISSTLYGVAENRRSYMKLQFSPKWKMGATTEEEWNKARDMNSTLLAIEVPFIPVTSFQETDLPPKGLTSADRKGNIWGASSLGLHLKKANHSEYQLKASWISRDNDDCQPNPCRNGGICQDHAKGFSCKCTAGYTGNTCAQEENDCDHKPCRNGGTCVDQFLSYKCICPGGFKGYHCEEDIDECVSHPCKNNGECRNTAGGYYCRCAKIWTGKHCQNPNDCWSDPCLNGATCVDKHNNYSCVCPDGITGSRCETDIDECESNPCENNGTCANVLGSYNCTCAPGWASTNCEASPCVHYTWITSGGRNRNFSTSNIKKCDKSLEKAWYRFGNESGSQMATSCVPMNHCEGEAPGWLNGNHPTVGEGIVSREVCFHGIGECCKWQWNINVKNCTSFYTYELIPTNKSKLRYCGE